MKTKTLLMIAAAGAGYLAYRGSKVAPAVPVTPANVGTLIRAGWDATVGAKIAPPPSPPPAASTPGATPGAQGYFGGSDTWS